jgi:hypothetical protein
MAQQNTSKNFTFKFIKSSGFKTIGIDGVYGGLNVKRHINMNFYVDAVDLPNSTLHAINEDTSIGAALPIEKKALATVRELQFGVNFDVNTAKAIVVWLNDKIKEAQDKETELANFRLKQVNKINNK